MDEQTGGQGIWQAELATSIVVAYVSRNHVQASDLPALIASVHAAVTSLTGLGHPVAPEAIGPEKPTPAQIRRSITPDALISFVDGKPYKMLRRHLTTQGLTLDEYRRRYGLPADYPATSANYSMKRSLLARSSGLGRKRQKAELEAAAGGTVSDEPKLRGGQDETVRTRGRKKVGETA